jgi:membrane fusion protein, multidrug efflux system
MVRATMVKIARLLGAPRWAAPGTALLAALLVTLAACGESGNPMERAAHADPAAAAPKVTVALPVVQEVQPWRAYTGRAEAVDSVEIRARVGGYLQRAAFREGNLVKKGDLLFVVDARPFAASHARAQAELDGARAEAALARLDAQRSDKLWAERVISESEHDRERSKVVQREALAKRAEAVVREAALDIEFSNLRAPIDGRIGRIQVTPGNLVGPSTPAPLTTLVSVDPLHVYVDVVEADALLLEGGKHSAAVGFPGETGYPHQATVDFIDNHVDAGTGTVKVRAVVKNPDGKLTPGLFARLRIATEQPRPTVLVIDSAFGTDQSHKFAYVIDEAGVVQYREVELGELHEGLRVVRRGLAAGDRVVVRGLQRARPGAAVDAEVMPMRELIEAEGGAR